MSVKIIIMKKIFLILACLACGLTLFAQGYRIEVTIDGVKDTVVYLAVYSGDSKYAVDTAYTDNKGHAVFQKDKPLTGGMYLLAMGGMQLFDFLISGDDYQQFSIYTKAPDYYANLKYTGSPENTGFIDFQQSLMQQQKRVTRLTELAKNDPTQQAMVQDSLAILDKEVQTYIKNKTEEFKGTLLASILKAALPAAAPEPNIPEGTPNRDSLVWAHYYQFTKNHFFDGIDFSDSRLIYSPILKPRVDEYFSRRLIQVPDSLIPQVDKVLQMAEANHDVYSTVLSQLFNKYVEADIMGMEKVAIHIGEKYVLTGKAAWLDSAAVAKIKDFVEHNQYSLIGMQAKELKLQNLTGQFESIYSTNSPYLLLVFYEPNCGHCKEEVPKIYKVYEKYRNKGLRAMAVCGIYNYKEWADFVNQHKINNWMNVWDGYIGQENASVGSKFREYYNVYTTPQVYLLDKDKKIIGRRLNAEVLEKILEFEMQKK